MNIYAKYYTKVKSLLFIQMFVIKLCLLNYAFILNIKEFI